ncbi:MAG: Glyoxalase/bleomycin resistance protein/dioxygenase [Sedimentibacter sp.]|jgi:lactoylglutathione lyase|nr:Glyoxalase/bleomycin resistance protein/dioxygenase [Sedimentibacter sp.]
MKFLWTTIHVKDMEESLNFYQEVVGLKLVNRFNAGPEMEICFLGEDDTKLELIFSKKMNNIQPGNAVSLGFKVESLDEMINLLKEKGIEIKTGPVQPNPSLKYLIVLDPNGVKIQFAQQSGK